MLSLISEYLESGNMTQLELKFHGLLFLLQVGLKDFLIDTTNLIIGFLKRDHPHSGWQVSSIHKDS